MRNLIAKSCIVLLVAGLCLAFLPQAQAGPPAQPTVRRIVHDVTVHEVAALEDRIAALERQIDTLLGKPAVASVSESDLKTYQRVKEFIENRNEARKSYQERLSELRSREPSAGEREPLDKVPNGDKQLKTSFVPMHILDGGRSKEIRCEPPE